MLNCIVWFRAIYPSLIISHSNVLVLYMEQQKVNLQMTAAETNQLLLLFHLQLRLLVILKVTHLPQKRPGSSKLPHSCGNSLSMISSPQRGTLDQRVSLVRVALVVCSKDGLRRTELLQSNLAQGLLLQLKLSTTMDFKGIKSGWYDFYVQFT